jgi:hypothetical protein
VTLKTKATLPFEMSSNTRSTIQRDVTEDFYSSGYLTYRQRFKTKKFHVLPTHCIYVFCVDLRTNSDYFPVQH